MISCVEWVPRGAADPHPKRYELSQAEIDALNAVEGDDDDDADDDAGDGVKVESEDEEDVKQLDSKDSKKKEKVELPKIDPSTLPPELRMEEYSDDGDEENEGAKVGSLLLGKDSEMLGTKTGEDGMPVMEQKDDDDDDEEKEGDDEEAMDDDKDEEDEKDVEEDSDDSDSDDDLADVADTREYTPLDVEGLQAMGLAHAGTNGAMYFDDMDGDEGGEEGDEDSDVEDTNLAPDDALIVVAKTEEDFATLEVHVYEETSGNLYVHHDIPLPSFPLCLAHGDINPNGGAGNYVAVGTFDPGIEVWNLDVLDALEPVCTLGGEDTSAADELMKINMARAAAGKKLKKPGSVGGDRKGSGLRPGSHTDAVMSLSWNKVHRQVIASGSADRTVKVWDVTRAGGKDGGRPAATFTHHRNKVQSVSWHPTEGTVLATGSFDRTVALVDARSSSSASSTSPSKGATNYRSAKIPADCESISWDPHKQMYLTCASEDGLVTNWDVRKFGEGPVWSFVAHEFGGVSDLSYNPLVPGMLATCAIDKAVALWDTHNLSSPSSPHPCGSKDMGVGKLYTVSFYPSSPWLLGCGGGGNQLSLWDMSSEGPIQSRFGNRVSSEKGGTVPAGGVEEGVVEDSGRKETDFEAIMAADAVTQKVREGGSSKKKGRGKKKKAHRKGR